MSRKTIRTSAIEAQPQHTRIRCCVELEVHGSRRTTCVDREIGHHADIAQAVARLLDAPSTAHRIYNVVDDEAPDLATLFASVGAQPPDGSDAERGSAFDVLLDGRLIHEDLGFNPQFHSLADAILAGASSAGT